MMEINWKQTEAMLEKNIKFIENSKKIYADINKLRQLNEKDYRILACADGKSYTIEKKTDKGFVRIHSAYEPHREAHIISEKLTPPENDAKQFVRFGFGFGYLYNYLLPKINKNGGYLVIYEPSYEIFNYFIRLFDISKLFLGYPVRLFVHDNADEVRKIFPYVLDAPIAETYSKTTLGYMLLFEEEIKQGSNAIEVFFKNEQINRNTLKLFGDQWAHNAISNMPYLMHNYGIDAFQGVLSGKPAIMVAGGPSLNKNVHLLKEVQGKVFIIAVYTAIKTLEKHGIKPDMFMAIDGRQLPYEVGEDYNFEDIPMLLQTSVSHAMYQQHGDNNFIFFREDGSPESILTNTVFKEVGKTVQTIGLPGGSVAHGAVSFLKYMGAETIVVLGQDLAYTGGESHAKEAFDGLDMDKDNFDASIKAREKIMVEDVFGNQVETDASYQMFITQFENFAEQNKDSLQIIDATEGGAKIEHTKIMPFRKAIDTYMADFTDLTFTKNLLENAKTQGFMFSETDKEKTIKTFEKMLGQCEKILNLTEEALPLAEKVFNLYKFNRIPTQKELNKPLRVYQEYVNKLTLGNLVSEAINLMWLAQFQESIALKRDDEPDGHFYVRNTSSLLTQQKERCITLVEILNDTLDTLKQKGA